MVEKIADTMGLTYAKPEEPGMGRFASVQKPKTAPETDEAIIRKLADGIVEAQERNFNANSALIDKIAEAVAERLAKAS